MKVTVIQPPYSMDLSKSQQYFDKKLELLEKCDDTMDIIVLPEYSDVPCAAATLEDNMYYHNKYIDILLDECKKTAVRCNAILFVNALYETETGFRNTTYCFDRKGNIIDRYYKKHLPPSEQYTLALDSDYTFEYSKPHVLEYEGIRFGFLTCYDFYFYEAFANIARENVDIIIGCSLQRSDTHSALEIMGRFLCYNTNAYLLRASVALDDSPDICGASMIVTPKGDVLVNMKADVGIASADIDINDKYYKPAGFGGKPAPHYEYIEFGRHPAQYRPGGSAITVPDEFMKYPRCAVKSNDLKTLGGEVALDINEIVITELSENIFRKFSSHAVINAVTDDANTVIALADKYDCKKYIYVTTSNKNVIERLSDAGIPCCFKGNDIESAVKYGCKKVWITDEKLLTKAHENNLKVVGSFDIADTVVKGETL